MFKNGSSSGALKKVVDGDADMTAGMYAITKARFKFLDATMSHFGFPFGAKLTPLQKLLIPFKQNVWMAIVIVVISGFIFIAKITKTTFYKNSHDDTFNVLSCHAEYLFKSWCIQIFSRMIVQSPWWHLTTWLRTIFISTCTQSGRITHKT